MKKLLLLSSLLVAPSAMGVVFDTGEVVGSTTISGTTTGPTTELATDGLNMTDTSGNTTENISVDAAVFTDNSAAGFEFDLTAASISVTRGNGGGNVANTYASYSWQVDFTVQFGETADVNLDFTYFLAEVGVDVVLDWALTDSAETTTYFSGSAGTNGTDDNGATATISEATGTALAEGSYKVVITATVNDPNAAIVPNKNGSIDVNNLNLTVAAIPEPSSALLCLLGGLGLLRRRRSA